MPKVHVGNGVYGFDADVVGIIECGACGHPHAATELVVVEFRDIQRGYCRECGWCGFFLLTPTEEEKELIRHQIMMLEQLLSKYDQLDERLPAEERILKTQRRFHDMIVK